MADRRAETVEVLFPVSGEEPVTKNALVGSKEQGN